MLGGSDAHAPSALRHPAGTVVSLEVVIDYFS